MKHGSSNQIISHFSLHKNGLLYLGCSGKTALLWGQQEISLVNVFVYGFKSPGQDPYKMIVRGPVINFCWKGFNIQNFKTHVCSFWLNSEEPLTWSRGSSLSAKTLAYCLLEILQLIPDREDFSPQTHLQKLDLQSHNQVPLKQELQSFCRE